MAKAKIELVYADKKTEHTVEFRMPDRRSKTLDAIDKAVEKIFKKDTAWIRWSLLEIEGL